MEPTLSELLARIEHLERQVDRDRSERSDGPGHRADAWDQSADRRTALKRIGAATVTAVAGGTALAATTEPASAATGDPLLLEQVNPVAVTSSTVVEAPAQQGDAVFVVREPGTTPQVNSMISAATKSHLYGVSGRGESGRTGMLAFSDSGIALWATTSNGGYAIRAETNGPGTGVFVRGAPHLWLLPSDAPPPSQTRFYQRGSVVMDDEADLWVCVAEGTPGTWRKLAGPNTAGALHLIAPTRVYDSRPADPPLGGVKGPLANDTRDVDTTANASGVPLGATAVLVNLTVVNTSTTGFLAAYEAGLAFPGTSSINWNQASTIVANTTIVAVDASARFTCLVPAGSSTDFFVDVIGYYR
jgi:hypothetical protein